MKSLENCLETLRGPEFIQAALPCLSGLNEEELQRFAEVWNNLPVQRRRRIISTLVEMAEDDVELDFGPVFRYTISDSDPEVRAQSCEGLWENCDDETAGLLIQALEQDPDPAVRAAAASALGHAVELIEMEAMGGMLAWRIKHALMDAHQRDPDPEVRRRALESLSFLSEPPIPELIERAYQSPDHDMRVSAIYAMGRNAGPQWREYLLKELRSNDPEIRFEAARSAGELDDEEMVWPLARLITDEDMEVRLQAISSLGEIGGELAERTLEGLAGGEDPAMREAAVEALEMLRSLDDPLSFYFNPEMNPNGKERHPGDEE